MAGFQAFFAALPDPRAANARHQLDEILLVALTATLCGAQTCGDIATFARAKLPVLRRFLRLAHGAPSHDTFSRVFQSLDPDAFEDASHRFMAAFARAQDDAGTTEPDSPRLIALDGKSVRKAVEAAHPTTPLHLVTAWATEQRLVLAQRHARNRSEVSAARAILALLDLRGTCVTADALHGSRATAAAILDGGGDYALILKGNRGPLHDAARDRLAHCDPEQAARTIETEHGRYEERCAWVCEVPGWAEEYGFAGLRAVARSDGLRRSPDAPDRATSCQTRYVALSRVLAPGDALRIVRSYWSIENDQHWLLDVAFREDDILTRNENAARNLALIRRMALNNLRRDPTKASIHTKMQMAGWDDDFLQRIIRHMR